MLKLKQVVTFKRKSYSIINPLSILKMKNTVKLLITGVLLLFTFSVFSQPEPPPDPNIDGQGMEGNGAPIASGLTILLTLGAAYGGARMYHLIQSKKEKN